MAPAKTRSWQWFPTSGQMAEPAVRGGWKSRWTGQKETITNLHIMKEDSGKIVTKVYGGKGVRLTPQHKLASSNNWKNWSYSTILSVWLRLKYSFSDDAKKLGAPKTFVVTIMAQSFCWCRLHRCFLTGAIMTTCQDYLKCQPAKRLMLTKTAISAVCSIITKNDKCPSKSSDFQKFPSGRERQNNIFPRQLATITGRIWLSALSNDYGWLKVSFSDLGGFHHSRWALDHMLRLHNASRQAEQF